MNGQKSIQGREKEKVAGTVAPAVALHGRRREARRSARFGGHGPRFDEPRAPGERGEQANTSGPIRRSEDTADKVADMAGGKELPGACDKAIQTTKREIN